MDLRALIEGIGQKYDPTLGMDSEAQLLLRQAGNELRQGIPGGYLPVGSGGKGNAAAVPWISIFDPDETDTARRGMYVVYLFAADMTSVALSLNQGVTELVEREGRREGRRKLQAQAAAIRDALDPGSIADLDAAIDLRSRKALPVHYEYGNIVARVYSLDALPTDAAMMDDLHRFIRLYEAALEAREELRRTSHDVIVTTVDGRKPPKVKPAEFKPKNDAEYTQQMAAQELIKSRKHETLIRQYGEFLQGRGFVLNTKVHPRDLTADAEDGRHWLIEAKMLRRGNGHLAAREALGQLFFYDQLHYRTDQRAHKLALFSESIGDLFVGILERFGVASVWKDGKGWAGSATARAAGLC